MKLIFVLTLIAVAPAFAQNATCKTSWPVQVCYTISNSPTSSRVVVGITSLETQSEYLPITGYVVNGRVQIEGGAFVPFQLSITRDDWKGENSATLSLPPDSAVVGVPHLTVIVRRNSETVIMY